MSTFPTNLIPDYPITETITYNTIAPTIPNGPSKTRRKWAEGVKRHGFQLSFKAITKLEMQLLVSFFNSMNGKYSSFTWTNTLDSESYTVKFADDTLQIDETGEDAFDTKVNLIEVF